jgi:hypothetical protein
MQETYMSADQRDELALSMHTFISLKLLYDAGYELDELCFRAGTAYPTNYELMEYVLKTVFENVVVDDIAIDGEEYMLYRVKINSFNKLTKGEIDFLDKKIKEIGEKIEDDMWWLPCDEFIDDWFVTKYGFEILARPYWVPYFFTKNMLELSRFLRKYLSERGSA